MYNDRSRYTRESPNNRGSYAYNLNLRAKYGDYTLEGPSINQGGGRYNQADQYLAQKRVRGPQRPVGVLEYEKQMYLYQVEKKEQERKQK